MRNGLQSKQKDVIIVLLLIIIIGMFVYHRYFQVNTSLKLYQRIGMAGTNYSKIDALFLKELQGTLPKAVYHDFKSLNEKGSPNKISQYSIFEYGELGKKVIIEVTPGQENVRIRSIDVKEDNSQGSFLD
ncbi:hypothetical protein [Bacillus sp. 1P06AnD]|uniref:hypothetical protein n=1 Tax=Bacillus sp. 1P06AnD TaxID=3132208 RepID=UPI0039A3EBE5